MKLHYRNAVIYQYDLDGHYIGSFKTCREASKAVYVYERRVERCCEGRTKTAGDFMWRKLPIGSPTTDIPPLVKEKISTESRPVVKLSLDGEFIAEYPSLKSAAIANHLDPKSIRETCKHKQYKSGGYIWLYKSEYEQQPKD